MKMILKIIGKIICWIIALGFWFLVILDAIIIRRSNGDSREAAIGFMLFYLIFALIFLILAITVTIRKRKPA